MDTIVAFPGVSPLVKELPPCLRELVEFAGGIGHATMIVDIPKPGSLDRNKDVGTMLEQFLTSSAEASGALVRGEAGRKVAGPALQAAIHAVRLAQYAMILEDERLRVATSQPQ